MKKEEIKEIFENVLKSKILKIILYIIGFLVIATLIFRMGMIAGVEKASFGRNWGDNYSENFGMMKNGPRMMMDDFDNFPNPHGAIGKIIKIDAGSVIVLDIKDNTEKAVLVSSDTIIKLARENVSLNDLKVNDSVIIIGSPNDSGQIEAKLIRIMPNPEYMPMVGDSLNK